MENFAAPTHTAEHSDEYSGRVLKLIMEVGHLLLENGAEIARVKETMRRMAACFGVDSTSSFVLSNGIFITGEETQGRSFAKVKHIPVRGARLDKVVAVNQLSRELEQNKLSLEEVEERVHSIRAMKPYSFWTQVLASAVGSMGFCIIFGGRLSDSLVSALAGAVAYMFLLGPGQKMSKITANLSGSIIVTLICAVFHYLRLESALSYAIIGSIIPLIPGVAFTNGIRDIANGDYLAGTVRLLDAVLVFLCIAIGVGVVVSGYQFLLGGVDLL